MNSNNTQSSFNDLQRGGIEVIPWIDGMNIGVGYDSITQVVKGTAADPDHDLILEPTVGRAAQTSVAKIRRIETTEELNDSLSISGCFGGNYGFFSGSISGKYIRENAINQYGLYFLINAFVVNDEEQIKNFKLREDLTSLNADEFRSKFGDYFVQGVITGGAFIALLELKTNSRKTKEEINASVDASYGIDYLGIDYLSVTGKFSNDIKKAASHQGVELAIQYELVGTAEQLLNLDTVQDLIETASNLPNMVQNNGTPMYAIIKPYSLLQDAPQTARNTLDLEALNTIKETLSRLFLRAKFILDSVEYTLSHMNQFNVSEDELQRIKKNMITTIEKVKDLSNRLKQAPDDSKKIAQEIPDTPVLDIIPPRIFEEKELIEVPLVTPLPLVVRLHATINNLDRINLDEELKQKCREYLDRIQRNIATNFNNAKEFLNIFPDYITAMDTPNRSPQRNQKIYEVLQGLLQKRWHEVKIDIKEQQAIYIQLEIEARNKNISLDYLDFLGGKDGLNPLIWSNDSSPDGRLYGQSGFWRYINEEILTKVRQIIGQLNNNERFSDRALFYANSWKSFANKFGEEAVNIFMIN